jgi:hypothetical protein
MTLERPHYFGHRKRLRERFLKNGLGGFADYEVVELLLTLAIPRKDVKRQAKELIAHFGNLRGILDAPLEELQAAGFPLYTEKVERVTRWALIDSVTSKISQNFRELNLARKGGKRLSVSWPFSGLKDE